VNGEAASPLASFSINPLGAVRLVSGGEGELGVGSAHLVSNAPVSSVVCFSFPGFGITGVGDSAALRGFAIPVVRQGGLNTGIALLNLEDYEIELELSLRRLTGLQVSGGLVTIFLPKGAKLAQFVNELFPQADTNDFQGSVRVLVKSSGNVAASAIQQGSLPGQFTTLPVIPVSPAATAKQLYFPQFGQGQGLASSLFLTNPSSLSATGQASFYGEDGQPLPVSVNGQAVAATVSISLPAYGSAVLSTSGAGDLAIGSAKVTTTRAIGGVLRFAISGVGITGVGASAPAASVIVPVSRSQSRQSATGVAIIAPGAASNLTLTLRNVNGQAVSGGVKTLALAANAHIAKYVHELFPQANTAEFEGTVTINAVGGQIAATAIELGSAPGEFTTFPVAPLQ